MDGETMREGGERLDGQLRASHLGDCHARPFDNDIGAASIRGQCTYKYIHRKVHF